MKRIATMIMVLATAVAAMGQNMYKNEKLRYGMYLGPIKAGEAELITKNVTYK